MFYIIAGGGISVIIGAFLALIRLRRIGKLIISLGSGTGLIGMIIFLLIEMTIITPINTWFEFGIFILRLLINLYFIGILMTIIGRKKIKNESDTKESELLHEIYQVKPQLRNNSEKKLCPICNSWNPIYSKFCRECATEIDYILEKHL
jgi:hypothetical protein